MFGALHSSLFLPTYQTVTAVVFLKRAPRTEFEFKKFLEEDGKKNS